MFNIEKIVNTVIAQKNEMKTIETQDFFSKKSIYINTINEANGLINSINQALMILEDKELNKEDQKIFDTYIKSKIEKFNDICGVVQEATDDYKDAEINAVIKMNDENKGTELTNIRK